MERSSLAAALPELELSALELVDRLLDRGVVLAGEATISVAEVDLVYLGLNLVLTGVERLHAGTANGGSNGVPVGPLGSGPTAPPATSAAPAPVPSQAPGAAPPPLTPAPARPATAAPGPPPTSSQELGGLLPERLDVDPDDVERGLAKLVLTVVELLRQVLERQAIRRMDGGTLSDAQVERMGLALLRLEERMLALLQSFGLERRDLNLSLGPLGRLL